MLIVETQRMYILNVTVNIADAIHEKGLHWVKSEFIPEMMATKNFTEALMTRIMMNEKSGGKSYAIHFTTETKQDLKDYYMENDAQIFKKFKQFNGKIVFFRTEMEVIHQA